MKPTRRDILQRLFLGLTILPPLLLGPRSLIGSLLFDPDGARVPSKPPPPNPFREGDRAIVALIRGVEPQSMVKEGLELLGGTSRLPLAGNSVIIKPNVVNNRPPPSTTSPRLLSAVLQVLRDAGPREMAVADSSGMLRFPSKTNLDATGITAVAGTYGARLLALEEYPWVRVEPPSARAVPHYYVSKPVYDADVFINLPVVKTHRFAHYSCSLKNLVGIVHPRYRPSLSFFSGDWHERIAELNLAVHPHLTIADATILMIAGGPTSGTPATANVILLSGDRVALDVVAIALIRSFGAWPKLQAGSPWDQRQVKRAVELGLGAGRPDRIVLRARSLLGPDDEFERLVDRLRADVNLPGRAEARA